MAVTIQTIVKPTRARGLDTSSNNNHAQIYSGRALEFDGVTDYLSVTGAAAGKTFIDYSAETTAANRAWTVAVWLNYDAAGSSNQMISGYDNSVDVSTSNYLRLSSTEKLGFYDIGGGVSRTGNTILKVKTWYRAVFVYNGSDTVNFYLNGVADGSGTLTSSDANNNADLNISLIGAGLQSSVFTNAFAGKMSDFQAWQGAWTADDVEYDYLNPEQLALNRGGTSLTNSNLKLWYPMNEGHRGNQSYVLDASNTGLGDNIVTNGTFDTDTHWHKGSSGGISISDGKLRWDGTQTNWAAAKNNQDGASNTTVSGQTYRAKFDWTRSTSTLQFKTGASHLNISSGTSGSADFTFIADGSYWYFTGNSDMIATVDNVEVYPINAKNNATTVFYSDEMVANGDSEVTDPTTITINGVALAALSSTVDDSTAQNNTSTGTKSIKVLCDGDTAWPGVRWIGGDEMSLIYGRTYYMECYVYGNTGGEINRLQLKYRSNDGTSVEIGSTTTLGSWQKLSGTFTIPDDITDIQIIGYKVSSSVDIPNTEFFYIDDISLKEVGVASGWTDADQQLDIPQTALQSYNQLAYFPGQDNYHVTLDSTIGSGYSGNWSVSFWLYEEENDYNFSWPLGVDGTRNILTKSSGTRKLHFRDSGSSYHLLADYIIPLGKWNHIVVTATGNTSMQAYINGQQFTANSDMSDTEFRLQTFMEGYSGNHFTKGSITEIAYHTSVLTEANVLDLYNNGKCKSALEASGSAGLTGYWRNNGLSEWKDLKGSNDGNCHANVTETMLITAGVDSSRDSQGFLMNRQKTTNSFNNNTIIDGDIDRGAYSKVETHPLYTGSAVTNYSISFWMKIGIKPSDFLTSGNSFSLFDTTISNSSRAFRASLNHNNILYMYTYYGTSAGNESVYCDYDLDSLNGSIVNPPTAPSNGIGEAFDPNKWYHVTFTFDHDRTTGSGNADNTNAEDHNFTPYFVYINGIQVAAEGREGANSAMTTARSMQNANVPMIIGSDIGTTGTITEASYQDFPGELDDLCFYSDTLTDEEVLRNYNTGKRSHR